MGVMGGLFFPVFCLGWHVSLFQGTGMRYRGATAHFTGLPFGTAVSTSLSLFGSPSPISKIFRPKEIVQEKNGTHVLFFNGHLLGVLSRTRAQTPD